MQNAWEIAQNAWELCKMMNMLAFCIKNNILLVKTQDYFPHDSGNPAFIQDSINLL